MFDLNIRSGANKKLAPLISFNTIVDLDFGLINFVYDKYLDTSVFNIDYFNKKPSEIAYDLYWRKNKNPLKEIAKPDVSDEKLDIYYKEFMEEKINEIYTYSISTNMIDTIQSFNESQIIEPIIFCYSNEQINLLDDEPILSKNKKILINSLSSKDLRIYKQFFLKSVDEINYFSKCIYKSFYISSLRCNFNESGEDFQDRDIIDNIIRNGNSIGIFDIYRNISILKGE